MHIYSFLLLQWHYSPAWALASFTIHLQASRSLALSLHSFIPIFLRSVDTSSSHLIFGLPLRLVTYSFPYIFFGIAVSYILSIWPSHRILWHLMNLTMFSPLIITSNSSFRRILHIYSFNDLKSTLTFWHRNYFFLILAHPVYKMWIKQEPNTLELWNKLHFEEKKTESIYHV